MSTTNDKSIPGADDASSMRRAYKFASEVLKSTTKDLTTRNAQLDTNVQDLKSANKQLLKLYQDSLQQQKAQLAQSTQLATALIAQDEQNRALRQEVKELREDDSEEQRRLRKEIEKLKTQLAQQQR